MKALLATLALILLSACGSAAGSDAPASNACAEFPHVGIWLDNYRHSLTIRNNCTAYDTRCDAEMSFVPQADGSVLLNVHTTNTFSYCLEKKEQLCTFFSPNSSELYITCDGLTGSYGKLIQ